MKKKALVAAIAVLLSFTACGTTENSEKSESEIETTIESETTVEETEPITEDSTEADEENTEEATTVVTEPQEFTPVEGLSENYADLENRSFAYDGKVFTLGKNTLQDLIDGGIPFKESELNNAGNNVNKNHSSGTYNVEINDYVSMQFEFVNTTETNIKESECLLQYVRWYSIYVPQPDYEDSRNEEINNNINDAATHVCFAFPLTLTKEQLLENNSEATEVTDSNYVKYNVDSEVYMGTSGYNFKFNKDTNQLEQVSISWLP